MGRSQASQGRHTLADELDANFGKLGAQNGDGICDGCQLSREGNEFDGREVNQTHRRVDRASISNQRVAHKERDFLQRTGFNNIAKSKRSQIVGGNPSFDNCRSAVGYGHLCGLFRIDESVLPAPLAHASVFTTPFIPLIQIEINRWACGEEAAVHTDLNLLDVPVRLS